MTISFPQKTKKIIRPFLKFRELIQFKKLSFAEISLLILRIFCGE